jgi:hypothetical protein
MDGAIDGKKGYEKTDHGPFLNMVPLLFPPGRSIIRKRVKKEENPDSPKLLTPAETILNIDFLCVIPSQKPANKLCTRER